MADADWILYRHFRGRPLPATADWFGTSYALSRVLKRDFYAIVGVYDRTRFRPGTPGQVLLKVYHTDPLKFLPLGWLGRWLCRREVRNLQHLDGIPGIPRLLGTHGPSGLIREFVPGCNLREYARHSTVDARFFPRLRRILEEVHRRRMTHNDLSKPENVLVRPDGSPVLIDFQIALRMGPGRWPVLSWLGRRLLKYQQRVDHYHLTKLHRRQRPFDFTPEERAAARRKGLVLTVHGWIRKPYRKVRHLVLRRFLMAEAPAETAIPVTDADGRLAA